MNKYLCGNTGIGTHTRLSSRWPVDGVAQPRTHVYTCGSHVLCARAWLMCAAAAAQQCHWHHATHTSFHKAGALAHEETHWLLSSYRSYITREDDYSPGTPTDHVWCSLFAREGFPFLSPSVSPDSAIETDWESCVAN